MKISKIFLALLPLLVVSSCTGNQEDIEDLPVPDSISLSVSDYQIDNEYTSLVKGFAYRLSVKSSDTGMRYKDIVWTFNNSSFTLTPMHSYKNKDTNKEYYFNLVAKQNTGSETISVAYKEISDVKTYSFLDTSINSSVSTSTAGLNNLDPNQVFYFNSYAEYSSFDNEYNVRKTSTYSESYFLNSDLAIANLSYSSSNLSINYQGAFIQEESLNIAFSFKEDEQASFDVKLKTYFIKLEKIAGISDASLFKSVQFN